MAKKQSKNPKRVVSGKGESKNPKTVLTNKQSAPTPPSQDVELFRHIKKRQGDAETLLERWKPLLREIAVYCSPDMDDFYYKEDRKGFNRKGRLVDNTGVDIIKHAADAILGRLIPNDADWFRFAVAPELKQQLSEDDRLNLEKQLEIQSSAVRTRIDGSNFRKAMRSAVRAFCTFGYAAIVPRVSPNGDLMFDTWANNTFAMEASPTTKSPGVFWIRKWKVRDWNRSNPSIPIQNKNADSDIEIVHCAIPAQNGWLMAIYENKGEQPLSVSIAEEPPVIIARQELAAGETYPTGEGARILPEAQMLNTIRTRHIQALALWVNPMFVVNSQVDPGTIQAQPGGRVLVDTTMENTGNAIQPLPVAGDPSSSANAINDSRMRIREALGITPAPADVPPGETATAWLIAKAKEQESYQAIIDDFRNECILPVMKRVVNQLRAAGFLPVNLTVDNRTFEIKVVGEADRTRKLAELQELRAAMETAAMIPPELASARIDFDKLLEKGFNAIGAEGILKTREEAAQYMQALQEEAAAIQQQEAAQA